MRWTAVVLAAAVCVTGCTLFSRHEKSKQPAAATTERAARLPNVVETFTGKVVLVPQGYRLKISDTEALRLTRAHRESDFAAPGEEIGLRKYYEKTLAVRGRRHGDWIWGADIIGQWNRPGESRGPNVMAPPAGEEQ